MMANCVLWILDKLFAFTLQVNTFACVKGAFSFILLNNFKPQRTHLYRFIQLAIFSDYKNFISVDSLV